MLLESLNAGVELFLSPLTISLTLFGILFGLLVGALPGLGPLMGIILMLPVAIEQPPIAAMGFLIAIFVGGSCGGSISAILLRIPGTPLAAATLFDGYPMAQKGRAADAIGIAISASAIGGLIGGTALIFLAPLLAQFASNFAPPEYTALAITGLVSIVVISGGSLIKGLLSGCFGLLLATIGTDEFSTGYRFTFDSHHMLNGFHIVAIVVGLFAISEMAFQIMGKSLTDRPNIPVVKASFSSLLLTLKRWENLIRSSAIGAFFGSLPGAGGVISSFTSYAVAKATAKDGEVYGEGAEGGVVATESANNATVGGTLVPSLALGIPGDASSAVLIGALLILGIFPGPGLFEQQPEIVGGVFLVYLASNVFLLIAGILTTPLFVYVLRIRKSHLIPIVLLMCAIGTFALQASVFDLWVMLVFGLIGILFRAADFPLAPIVIGTILGPLLENNLRRSLLISNDGLWIFLERPVSAILLAMNALLIAGAVIYAIKKASR
ncbi:putative Tripartite tricarboxylate transporter TctA family [Vibrio nigripulchritudo MADA3029]|uniref:tripartite tricarboxylate transporter permease n=1 Tax=Vibrio nigripulchritudo TaxID=28173 RepID=UPI0003B1D471|nr:tripartite tricarboxylate transporter permease [Vibrio nigripulchritudo]CCN47716.1 putative Tripartite tricarboxylate transporter TctA family [Vibrio nigripulchritudo MADA3020]CCN53826.1 putative Tripartite tricarboxylate transporter TctA family [Vibrio nigripulchritudo MADA3021]CCN61770.1 putative Tripartite tricarboxylate transporter TctA family [Vibrio nigripulchritudo MADA3029]